MIRFYESLGGQVGQDEDNLESIPDLTPGQDVYGTPASLKTTDVEMDLSGIVDTDGSVTLKQDGPWPFTVLGTVTDIGVLEA